MQSNERVVVLRVGEPNRILPKDVQHETVNSVGSKFDSTKKGVLLMGLSEIERRYLLPQIIDVKPTDPEWNKRVRLFYANLTIKPDPTDGLRLNISGTKIKSKIEGMGDEEHEVFQPDSTVDYVMYKQCLKDDTVANSHRDAKEGTFLFYLDDEEAEKIREMELNKSILKIEQIYNDICRMDESDSFVNLKEMKLIARMLGKNPDVLDESELIQVLKQSRIRSVKQLNDGFDLSRTDFIVIAKDPLLKKKAIVLELVEHGILIQEKDYFIDAEDRGLVLGSSLEEAVKFISNPINSDKVTFYKGKLQRVKKSEEVQVE